MMMEARKVGVALKTFKLKIEIYLIFSIILFLSSTIVAFGENLTDVFSVGYKKVEGKWVVDKLIVPRSSTKEIIQTISRTDVFQAKCLSFRYSVKDVNLEILRYLDNQFPSLEEVEFDLSGLDRETCENIINLILQIEKIKILKLAHVPEIRWGRIKEGCFVNQIMAEGVGVNDHAVEKILSFSKTNILYLNGYIGKELFEKIQKNKELIEVGIISQIMEIDGRKRKCIFLSNNTDELWILTPNLYAASKFKRAVFYVNDAPSAFKAKEILEKEEAKIESIYIDSSYLSFEEYSKLLSIIPPTVGLYINACKVCDAPHDYSFHDLFQKYDNVIAFSGHFFPVNKNIIDLFAKQNSVLSVDFSYNYNNYTLTQDEISMLVSSPIKSVSLRSMNSEYEWAKIIRDSKIGHLNFLNITGNKLELNKFIESLDGTSLKYVLVGIIPYEDYFNPYTFISK